MESELKRQKQHGEDAAIKRVYGYSFSRQSYNNIMDGFLRVYTRTGTQAANLLLS